MVGSLTNTILHKLKGRDLLEGFKKRHPDVAKLVQGLPIVVCKEIELGLRGAYFIALRTFNRNK